MVKRILVTKRPELDVEGTSLYKQIREFLQIDSIEKVTVYNGYDVEGLSDSEMEKAIECVFSEPNADFVSEQITLETGEQVVFFKLLPGQYDQRADSAKQCIAILGLGQDVGLQCFRAVVLKGNPTPEALNSIKKFLINPVEALEIPAQAPLSTAVILPVPSAINRYDGFNQMNEAALETFIKAEGLAMNVEDLKMVQTYFQSENREPSNTEIKVLDTYWSDHCRHTTFTTEITDVTFGETGETSAYSALLAKAEKEYHDMRQLVYGERAKTRPVTLMDLATINAKYLKKQGKLSDVLESEEINAATFETEVTFEDGSKAPYWILFKNETHNHPTEIEPFGGAATCLGGAIRDPLSGRALVYQGMRITGAADPRASLEETLAGKLPQRVITRGAAKGFSSYGNQIGLATGLVREYYHDGFLAKRMEVGAVVGAVPKDQVRRESPVSGDVILLIGGKTGIDGCGGATGSSKEHDEASLATCASEVQRGNAPEERKLQRLYSRADFAALVKKSNDFGAGGVSVAVGELADSLIINLDAVRSKYEGLDGTQLAISESQERMAVVVSPKDAAAVIALSASENLEAYQVAEVTDSGYLTMTWKGDTILHLKRAFVETNGAKREQNVVVKTETPDVDAALKNTLKENKTLKAVADDLAQSLNFCSQEGLVEMFDNSVGALSVHMPFGGRRQKTPTQAMVSKIPAYEVHGKNVTTATVMAAGYDPEVLSADPFSGGAKCTVEALAKVIAVGGELGKVKFSMQEYFEKLADDPKKWGNPYKALLGSAYALKGLELCAIGGKDSMSGTFKEKTVPPTLIAFAATVAESEHVVSPEFKAENEDLYLIDVDKDAFGIPNFENLKTVYELYGKLIAANVIGSAMALEQGGLLGALIKMSFGNQIGVQVASEFEFTTSEWLQARYGALVFTIKKETSISPEGQALVSETLGVLIDMGLANKFGNTIDKWSLETGKESIALGDVEKMWEAPLSEIFPRVKAATGEALVSGLVGTYDLDKLAVNVLKGAKPKVFIPAFPGTNCEMDTMRAFELAGAEAHVEVFRNKTASDVSYSIESYIKAVRSSQMIALPGGFSAGDEPDGSGKFICSVLRNPELAEEVMKLLRERDGLMIGICNGFQALVKLGLVTYGEIRTLEDDAPTLTYNTCGKHISKIVSIFSVKNDSPWLKNAEVGAEYQVAMSHGEGRFFCNDTWYEQLKAKGQLATHYAPGSNLNGSMFDIEGITSPDGRIFGKMGHAERIGQNTYKNVPGRYDMGIFKAGVAYFKR